MTGWIKLHRKLLTSDIFQNEKLLKVFIYCLTKATHDDYQQRVGKKTVDLKPGQFVFGRRKAALELNMSESTVRDYMKVLTDDNVITVSPTNKYSIVTIVNWAVYQSKEDDDRQQKHQQDDNKKTAKGQQNDTNKNIKNIKKSSRARVFQIYESNFGMPSVTDAEKIHFWIDDMGEEMVIEAMRVSYKKGKLFWGFVEGVLKEWVRKDYKSVLDIEAERKPKKREEEMDNIEILAKYAKEKYGIERLPDIV